MKSVKSKQTVFVTGSFLKMVFLARLTPGRCILAITIPFGLLIYFTSAVLKEISDSVQNPINGNVRDNSAPFPGKELRNLHWFVQVSDIHVSIFYDKQRAPDLTTFIQDYLIDMIKPEVVLVTGDLTDAKTVDKMGSKQYLEEWRIYKKVLDDTGIQNHTKWLDIRGNHDVFSVPSDDSPQNYYRQYSAQGRLNPSHYWYKHSTKDGNSYAFIAIDSCPMPGPRRPFNFFGHLNERDLDTLRRFRSEAVGSNKTFWFGHYPSSTVYAPDPGLRSIFGEGGIFMSGHLHTLLDIATRMHARMQQNYMELEVGDWKDNRRFRVFAVDHDMFSFSDHVFERLPIILITNPKNALFNQPIEEPVGRIRHSTHIRILVFSRGRITRVSVSINGQLLGNAEHSEGPLYVLPWKPEFYFRGIHFMSVSAKDSLGNEQTVTQSFCMDNTKMHFDWLPRYLLMFDHIFFCKSFFVGALCTALLPLVLLRFLNIQVETTYSGQSCQGCLSRWVQTWLRRFYLLSHTDRLFYPLLLFLIYICLGPWFIGEVMEGHIGAVFVYGIYVYGTYIPGTLTYMYGFFQIAWFNIPLHLYLARTVDLSISQHKHPPTTTNNQSSNTKISRGIRWLKDHGFFVVLLCIQFNMAYVGFYKAYGLLAFILGPVRTWSIPLAIYLRAVALKQGLIQRVHQAVPVVHEPVDINDDNERDHNA